MKIVSVEEMRGLEERAASEYSLTSAILMESAGSSAAEIFRDWAGGSVADRSIVILLGPGNNGGDGKVVARYLQAWGAQVTLYQWKEHELVIGGTPVTLGNDLSALQSVISRADFIIDALLGTGRSRPMDPSMRQILGMVEQVRELQPELKVVAIDLPSGLNADNGEVDEGTIPADLTITLANPKLGMFFFPGAEYIGDLRVGDIGLPEGMDDSIKNIMITDQIVRDILPERPLNSHKGTFGKAMLVAGSLPYPGSAYLASCAAGRVGAGLVTLAVHELLAPVYAAKLNEATLYVMEDNDPAKQASLLLEAMQDYKVLLFGPGVGRNKYAADFLREICSGITRMKAPDRPALVVDADGLNNLADMDNWWTVLPEGTILTPHPGEMSRLTGGQKISGGERDRLDIVRDRASSWGHIVVLKGACTLVASPDGEVYFNRQMNSALATAGSGDVLAGIITGLLAQGVPAVDAAAAGVFIHAASATIWSRTNGDSGLLASDLLPLIPQCLNSLKAQVQSSQMLSPQLV